MLGVPFPVLFAEAKGGIGKGRYSVVCACRDRIEIKPMGAENEQRIHNRVFNIVRDNQDGQGGWRNDVVRCDKKAGGDMLIDTLSSRYKIREEVIHMTDTEVPVLTSIVLSENGTRTGRVQSPWRSIGSLPLHQLADE